jgi:hypothetical protein
MEPDPGPGDVDDKLKLERTRQLISKKSRT